MDAAHEAELQRIIEKRKAGGRLIAGAGGGMGAGAPTTTNTTASSTSGGVVQPISMKQPLYAAGASPKAAAAPGSTTMDSGAITIEDGGAGGGGRAPLAQAPSPTTAAAGLRGNNKYVTGGGATSPTYSSGGNSNINNNNNAGLADVLHEIQQQNRIQAQQLKSLQQSVEQLAHNTSPQRGGGSGGAGQQMQRGGGGGGASAVTTVSSGHYPTGANKDIPPPSPKMQHQQDPYVNRTNDMVAAEPTPDEIARSMAFQDAAALGLVVKPRSIVTSTGSRIISFRSPSRNQRGTSAGRRSGLTPHRHHQQQQQQQRSSPMMGSGNRQQSPNRQHQQGSSTSRGGGALITRDVVDDGSSPFRMPRTSRRDPIAKPFSTSTIDVDSAIVLLTTGDWFYKLRVNINASSLMGPAGWDVLTSDRRYVYLDTTTYILRWADKPGGTATLWSHFLPINDIVDVNIHAKNETLRGPEAKIVYYLVISLAEGGFSARGRRPQRRLCIFATEMRDKADMWYDALTSISKFYKTRGAAASVAQRTFSSD